MKKNILAACLLSICAIGFSGPRYFVNGGTNNNWNSTSNWSTTSGGTGGSAVPTSSDTVTFDANSPNCTINAAGVCIRLICTNYTNTLTFSNSLTVSGNITLGSGMSFAGSSTLVVNANATLNSNGVTLTVPLEFLSSVYNTNLAITLASNWQVENFTWNAAVADYDGGVTMSGDTLFVGGNFSTSYTAGSGNFDLSGTTVVILNGTGTDMEVYGDAYIGLPVIINTTGTLTFSDEFDVLDVGAGQYGSLTYVAGTVVVNSGHQLYSDGAPLATGTILWDNVLFYNPVTLYSDLHMSGNLSSLGNPQTINGSSYTVYVGGSLSNTTYNGTCKGIVMNGTGSIGNTASPGLEIPLTINTTGTVTFSSGANYISTGCILKYTAGTVVSTGSIIYIGGNVTLDMGGITMNALTVNAAGITITMNSGLVLSGALTSLVATAASHSSFVSSVSGTRRALTLLQGATQSIGFTNATDMDSSGGQSIWSWQGGSPIGTFSNCLNWRNFTPTQQTRGYTF